MNKNDVVTVVCAAGEFVGKFVEQTESGLELKNPRMLVNGPEGQMGFARGICMTGVENPDSVIFNTYIFVTPANDDIVKAFTEATSGIII